MNRTVSAMTLSLLIASATVAPVDAKEGGTLYFGLSGEPTTMDPMIQTGTTFRTIKLAIHRGLLNYGVDGKLSLELAESYEVAPDAKSVIFHLRDATFHDGSPVTADDVKASFERIIAKDSKASFRNELSIISGIELPDQKTVKFSLSKPSVSFLHFVALPESVILPAKWIKEHGDDPGAAPIGAGPFKFVNWERGRQLVVEKYDGYYKKGKPHLDEIDYSFYANETTRVNAIKSGDVDIIDYVPAKDIESLQADGDIRLERTNGPFMGLQINTKFEPFSKPEVRQALAYAIDRNVIIDTAFNGVGSPIYGLAIPEGYIGYDPAKTHYFSHDIEKAKELMAKAGYPNGFEVKLLASSQYSFHQNTAVAVQSELAKIGIKVTLDLPDWSGRMAKAIAGDYQFAVLGSLGEITDPDWLSNYYYGGEQLVRTNNSPYFDDPEINALLDKGRATVDNAEREKIYAKFADRALELSPLVFLMWRDQSYAVRNTVVGFTNMPSFLSFQSGFSLENTELK